jgi:phosphoserine phosphatase
MTPEKLNHHHPQAVLFDLDSTLVTIEGIDELARFKGVEQKIQELTRQAMNGEIPFEEVIFRRLAIIRPTVDDITALGQLYCASITQGAKEVIDQLHKWQVKPFVISGGYNPAVQMVTQLLSIPNIQVFANELLFDPEGAYQRVNQKLPLWKNTGKQEVVAKLKAAIPGRVIMIGDSMSDFEAGRLTDQFICFAGVANRPSVMQKADLTVTDSSLAAILPYL